MIHFISFFYLSVLKAMDIEELSAPARLRVCPSLPRGTGDTSASFIIMAASVSLRDAKEALKKYLPYSGLAGYSVLALHSVKVYPEELIISKDSRAVIFHGALVLSGVGLSTYMFSRPVFDVMQPPQKKRVLWSLFGSWMFNFGSLLLWAICKEIFPKNKVLRAFVALSSSAGLVYIAKDYLHAVDALRWGVIAERTEGGQEL